MQAPGSTSLPRILKTVLDILWYFCLILMVVWLGSMVYSIISGGLVENGVSFKVPITIDPKGYQITAPGVESASFTLSKTTSVLNIRSPGFLLSALYILGEIVVIAVFLLILYQLRAVIHTVSSGEPFALANSTRIRFIGIALIIGEVFNALLHSGLSRYFSNAYSTTGITLQAEIQSPLLMIGIGLILIVLGEVFRIGTAMREDQALTI